MHQIKKTSLLLLAALSLTAYLGTAQSISADTTPAVNQTNPVQPDLVWTEENMLEGLESLWWYEEERSLVLFTEEGNEEGNFHFVELRNVTSLSEALEAIQQPAFQYTVEAFYPEAGRMAVDRTTTTGYAEEYTLAPDGKTMDVHFPEQEATFTYVYVGEAEDIPDVLKEKMSGGGAIEVPE